MEAVPNLRIQGNHDFYSGYAQFVHYNIQAYSEDVTWGDKIGGYFYRDFTDKKLRIICVNTTETDNANLTVSDTQYNWFIGALDLSARSDASDWQILILSHHPLDWYSSSYVFCYILEAYKAGSSWSSGNISCNFAGKNSATLIGNIHGHIHNLLTDYINKGNVVNPNPTNVLRICTPEACINRANQYDGAWKDTATYNKTTNSVNDTSFVVYCIDLNAQNIKAFCYGAGYDREISYAPIAPTVYNITNNLTNCIASGASSIIEDGTAAITIVANDGYQLPDTINVSGASYTWNKSTGTVILSNPTKDVTVTAVAIEIPVNYTNQIPLSINADGSQFVGTNGEDGYKLDYRMNSSGVETAATGVGVTGYIPIKTGDTVYLKNLLMHRTNNSGVYTHSYITLFKSDFSLLNSAKVPQISSSFDYLFGDSFMVDADGYVTSFQLTDKYNSFKNGGYLRISAPGMSSKSVITINEPIDSNESINPDEPTTPDTPAYTNLIPLSTDNSGNLYNNGKGYKENTRLNSSGVEASYDGIEVTGFIPVKLGDVIYFKNVGAYAHGNHANKAYQYFAVYDENKNKLESQIISYLNADNNSVVYENNDLSVDGRKIIQINTANAVSIDGSKDWRKSNMAYFRISAEEITDESIITVNEPLFDVSNTYEITKDLTNCTATGAVNITENTTASIVITADANYSLPESIVVSGASYTWDKSSGAIVLSNPTSNIVITVIAVKAEIEPSYTNQVMNSVENDGITPYNGGQRYKTNTRYNSSCAEAEFDSIISGYIPYNSNVKVIRIKGFTKEPTNNDYFYTFDENFQKYGQGTSTINYFINRYSQWLSNWPTAAKFEMGEDGVGIVTLDTEELDKVSNTYPPILRESKWIRFNVTYAKPENFIITFDEEIK